LLNFKQPVLVIFLSTSIFSINAYSQNSYQTELIASYEKQDQDTSENNLAGVTAEFYFDPVTTENKPLAEAAFLSKISSVEIGYIKDELKPDNSSFTTLDSTSAGASINYITDIQSFVLGAIYLRDSFDTNNNTITADGDTFGVALGKYLNDTSAIDLIYVQHDIDFETPSTRPPLKIKRIEIEYKTVQPLESNKYYNLEFVFSLIKLENNAIKEDNNELSIAGDYYFTLESSLGAGLTINSGDDKSDEGKTFTVNATHFFNPHIALNIEIEKFKADDNLEEDSKSIAADLIARF